MRIKPVHVLGMLVAFTALAGLVDALEQAHGREAQWWSVVSTLVFSFLCFYWYRLDSDRRAYRRTRWLNVGVVMLAIVAVPYYLARSRPRGQKMRAFLRLGGFVLLLGGAGVLGAAVLIPFG